ncbi:PREDICTED: transcription factor bHLH113 [Nelumbo nucifera]|uniref:Transcription factor bHLH113 n=1 Tax=Nelumbo nucifera TaxID=4432 RepID=A0A1U8ATW5_NELNU|nr:PREDICTED: transcription factor bHLH113 [Nelumbo nucifera]
MAANEGYDDDPLVTGSFSQLMGSGDVVGLDMAESFIYPSSFPTVNPPKMLCFGNACNQGVGERGFSDQGMVAQKSGITGSDSSSASSSNNSSSSSLSRSKKPESGEVKTEQKKRNGSAPASAPRLNSTSEAPNENRKTYKRTKTENLASTRPTKAKKEKLGERITALQQLVSPFGKTDTASVLHEAMGYIKFLHDQVQVLSSPYLQRLPSSSHHLHEGRENEDDESRYDLRSRGLCLVPVACTVHVADSNGADFWSPAMGSSNTKH